MAEEVIKDMCESCLEDFDERVLLECSECGAVICVDCLEFGKCPDCKEEDQKLCEGCGCEVIDNLVECPKCMAMVGDCCFNQIEGQCNYCVGG